MTELISSSEIALEQEIHLWEQDRIRPVFWWRDDDLQQVTDRFLTVLDYSEEFSLPIVFATIPDGHSANIVDRIRNSTHCYVAVHGFAHKNHAEEGVPPTEYPPNRHRKEVMREISFGRSVLKPAFSDRYMNMFVPPWSRFDLRWRDFLLRNRFDVVSVWKNKYELQGEGLIQINCHVSPEYKRAPADLAEQLQVITNELQLRRTGKLARDKPIGILTHHRAFDASVMARLRELLTVLNRHDLDWRSVVDHFGGARNPADAPPGRPEVDGPAVAATATARPIRVAGEKTALRSILRELFKMSPIAALRWAHIRNALSRLKPGARILSAGCGKGLAELALASEFPEFSWTCIDFDEARFAMADVIRKTSDLQNIAFRICDLDDLDNADLGSYDAIIAVEVLAYLKDVKGTITTLAGMLNPGGFIQAIEPFAEPGISANARQALMDHGKFRQVFSTDSLNEAFGALTTVELGNCYWAHPMAELTRAWGGEGGFDDPARIEAIASLARRDVRLATAASRREASAVRILVERP